MNISELKTRLNGITDPEKRVAIFRDWDDEYQTESGNSVRMYLETQPKIVNNTIYNVYCDYQIWCVKRNYIPITKLLFTRKLCQMKNMYSKTVTQDGKSVRIYQTKLPDEINE